MPELPEVETTVRFLKRKVRNRTFLDVWTDWAKIIKHPKSFEVFKKTIKNKKIKNVWRRGKNIILNLSGGKVLLVHQKLTGHLLIGGWKREAGHWIPLTRGALNDPTNRFLHLIFFLDNKKMLALSDLRKFAKVLLLDEGELKNLKDLKELGPEPLDKNFTFEKFKECFKGKNGKIKKILMDQTIIAGIGNIYSDEILWEAKINPLKNIETLNNEKLRTFYKAMQRILRKGIEFRGESFRDYRMPNGEKGGYDKFRKVYRREGEKCRRCQTIIKRIKIGGRSAHFCPACQGLSSKPR